jgi:hypothetical protein
MSSQSPTIAGYKRKRIPKKNAPLRESDAKAAEAATHQNIIVPTKTGTTTKHVKVPLVGIVDERGSLSTAPENEIDMAMDVDHDHGHVQEDAVHSTKSHKVRDSLANDTDLRLNTLPKTQRDYVLQFVDRVDELLQSLLVRESMDQKKCLDCSANNWAVWRCIDCNLPKPMCRRCMRHSHQQSPLHRIEYWTGTFYRRAALWEVGTYILVQHRNSTTACRALEFQKKHLESIQHHADEAEQEKWTGLGPPAPCYMAPATPAPRDDISQEEVDGSSPMNWDQESAADERFFAHVESLRTQLRGDLGNEVDGDDGEDADEDEVNVPRYLSQGAAQSVPLNEGGEADENVWAESNASADITAGPHSGAGSSAGAGQYSQAQIPHTDALNNSYVRVVHVNGIHHLAMVTCQCQGEHQVPLDLVSSRLVPASFDCIRTLFTTQVLDYFRLCNLELKASAYQFYQLIHRLTLPISPASVPNLYHEFRRMSRLWRWIKKLKWAGYGHNNQNPNAPLPGALSNFCPACPQPGINLPVDWKSDPCR